MRLVVYVRRGARAGICVLALGATAASAQQPPTANPPANTEQSAPTSETSPAPAATQTAPPSAAPTSNLPELVVDGQEKKKKKVAKAKQETGASPTSTSAAETPDSEKPPAVTLGTTAPSDTGTTTFDASAVQMRTTGSGDANTFMRNLPNVQYQNQNGTNGGTTSQRAIDTKPAEISISGGRTYENNFIINGVSVNNILGNKSADPTELSDRTMTPPYTNPVGLSTQTVYVPTDFIGQATVIDSNASAEYGQFLGGVVMYDLTAAPFDRYHASVSATREDSDYASYVNGRTDGKNPLNLAPPQYTKTKLSASVGAPITPDFAFIGQVSRQEADSTKPKAAWVGPGTIDEYSDNLFMRFSAIAKTDIGKFTLDTSRTNYLQHWEAFNSNGVYIDVDNVGTTTKLEHETKLAGIKDDAVGLGNVRIKSRAFYNTSDAENTSGDNHGWYRTVQRLIDQKPGSPSEWMTSQYIIPGDCEAQGQPKNASNSYSTTNTSTGPKTFILTCAEGGFGDQYQRQTDYGIDTTIDGDFLFGKFKVGGDIKHYDGSMGRPEDFSFGSATITLKDKVNVGPVLYPASATVIEDSRQPFPYSSFICGGYVFCSPNQYTSGFTVFKAYDAAAQVNAVHGFSELDQTIDWFNVRAGVRVDYDDYLQNINVAPRLAATVKPFDGVSITGGYNQYYLGETLYYAVRSKVPQGRTYSVPAPVDNGMGQGVITAPTITEANLFGNYKFDGLATPYSDEYSAGVNIKDPLLGGAWRLRYLERYGHDQFSTKLCPGSTSNCYIASNDGSTSYRSASAEYTKQWSGLRNAFELNAAAVTGNVTWSEQSTRGDSYVVNADVNGDGADDGSRRIAYNGQSYLPDQWTGVVTGNLDIPVRFGATVATRWFDGLLELNASAGVNLGYQGVAYSGGPPTVAVPGCTPLTSCSLYVDHQFGATLKLDFSGRLNVTENAYIEAFANNVTSSGQNVIANGESPWVLARTFWVGSGLKF
jgi:hypothetical protein